MLGKPTMLIVDDSELSRRSLKRVFLGECEFIEAKNGKEAMLALKSEERISIVLLDAIMPEMNGFQLLEWMQANSRFSCIPVVMVTQQDDEYTEIKALELGAADFIAKPYKSQIIRRRVKNIVVKTELEFKQKSKYDSLTGIYAKETFIEKTSQLLRENTHKTYAIIMWNVERFKLINDLFGSKEGDRVLIGMAKALTELINGIGTYGRLAADHFVICIPYSSLDMEELLKQANRGFKQFKTDYAVVSNFGIYVVEDITMPVEIMCDRAGMALQKSKGNFLKPYAFYKENYRTNLLREQRLAKAMNTAIEEEQFEVYYQPVFSLSSGEAISSEALVRWNHPTRKVIPAGQFIPAFEKNGFIKLLDVFVLEQVCKQLKAWKDSGEKFLPVSINISALNFYDPNLYKVIINLVEKYDIKPSMMRFEITERVCYEDVIRDLTSIRKLHQYGFSILMSDFDSGHSAFNMLREILIDEIKIDLRFLEGFHRTGRLGSVLTSIVCMARWINISVVVVGVETREQVTFLRSIGCDMMQGHYFSRPLTKAQMESFMRNPFEFSKEALDIEESVNLDNLFDTNYAYNQIFNNIVGGVGIYGLVEDRLEVIRVNDGYYKMMGYTPQTFVHDANDILCRVFEEDRDDLVEKCKNACENKGMEEMVMRRYDAKGNLRWFQINIRYLGGNISRPLFCFAFKDITAEKAAERNLTSVVQELESTGGSVPIGVGVYRTGSRSKRIYISSDVCKLFGVNKNEYEQYMQDEVEDGFSAKLFKYLKENFEGYEIIGQMPFSEIFYLTWRDGSRIKLKVDGVVSQGEEKGCICCCTIFDVTKALLLEDYLNLDDGTVRC